MARKSDSGKALSLVGASLLLVLTAALLYFRYGEEPAATRVIILMFMAAFSALLIPTGWLVRSLGRRKEMSASKTPRGAQPQGGRGGAPGR